MSLDSDEIVTQLSSAQKLIRSYESKMKRMQRTIANQKRQIARLKDRIEAMESSPSSSSEEEEEEDIPQAPFMTLVWYDPEPPEDDDAITRARKWLLGVINGLYDSEIISLRDIATDKRTGRLHFINFRRMADAHDVLARLDGQLVKRGREHVHILLYPEDKDYKSPYRHQRSVYFRWVYEHAPASARLIKRSLGARLRPHITRIMIREDGSGGVVVFDSQRLARAVLTIGSDWYRGELEHPNPRHKETTIAILERCRRPRWRRRRT